MFRSCMGSNPSLRSFTFVDEEEETFEPVEAPIPIVNVLLEVVGATNLPTKAGTRLVGERILPDPYCIVSIVRSASRTPEVVHRTQTICKDDNPIWTIKTKSLCVVSIPKYDPQRQQLPISLDKAKQKDENNQVVPASDVSVTSLASYGTALSSDSLMDNSVIASPSEANCLIIQVRNGKTSLGKVEVSFQHVLQCNGERQEFPLVTDNSPPPPASMEDNDNMSMLLQPQEETSLTQSMLALRFRPAKPDEITFLNNLRRNRNVFVSASRRLSRSLSSASERPEEPSHDEEAMDVNFRLVVRKSIFSSYRKTQGKTGEPLVKLQPPKRNALQPEKSIEWMTKTQIQAEALKPSTKWVETGHGEAGTLYLEILGCDNLPGMDTGIVEDSSDPFVGIVFEDTMVRTQVLFETCTPRWLPWSTRAFAFNIAHSSSMLFLGVFDYDENMPLQKDYHDPIGRTVINTINFESSVTYLLRYDLIDSSKLDTPRGTITVRLRIEWADENEAVKLALTAPPRMIINVETEKAWHVLHYCTYGGINMNSPSMASVRLYASEVYEIWRNYCYFLDVVANILLWRGRVNLTLFEYSANIWFPIQSIWLFVSVALAYEKPSYAPAIFFYGLAWIMISINYCSSRHPYAWYRVKRFESLVLSTLLGTAASSTRSVEADSTAEEKATYDALDKLKADRMMALMSAFIRTGLKAYRIYSGTNIASIVDTTPDTSFYFLSDKLYYPHMLLKYFCNYSRAFRNFINWKSYNSFPKTLNLLILGSICLISPLRTVAAYTGRILIWIFLGPFMKVVDIVCVRYQYKTNEDLLDDIRNDRQDSDYWFLPFFDSIVEHESFDSMRKTGRLVVEDAAKLKDMREVLHGKWSETVPWVDNSRRPSAPLPASSAVPRSADCDKLEQTFSWKFARGKQLEGDMIMGCPGCPGSTRCVGKVESKKDQ
ncbi:expressed unknown protein [Seminavis robusta]|uniref:C2 domain-containing protein n=1 Tax=Seminavis robusta TaxID=568900 RepID=A0A9N8HQW4_9STRA|nr:expressed unknown protein [Seminavis robusta]|eukprot:Sro1493_g277270.1 n/a (941) ;mRNA; f:6531-9747